MSTHAANPIVTERLRLVPLDRGRLVTLLVRPDQVARSLGCEGLPGWADRSFLAVVPSLVNALDDDPEIPAWNRAIECVQTRRLVGTVASINPPDESGTVVLGYSVAESVRGQGYATEAAAGFLQWAAWDRRVGEVLAFCEQTNHASRRVLEKLGFALAALREDSTVWRLDPRSLTQEV